MIASGKVPFRGLPNVEDIYDNFMVLTPESAELGGSLLVYAGLDWRGIALGIVANIAGVASLGLDSDLAQGKAAIRNGACDFLVNTLDEALRILKNEIRKKNPVAVVLVGDPGGAVAELVERGVQPDGHPGGKGGVADWRGAGSGLGGVLVGGAGSAAVAAGDRSAGDGSAGPGGQ